MITEINFDGIVGPTHNYAGLSPGNVASAKNSGATSRPRDAALQGLDKMRTNAALGLPQGWFMPLARPDDGWLRSLGGDDHSVAPHIRAASWSASSMWAANAATVSPAADTADGRCHLTVANLVTMAHRSHEWPGTLAQLRVAFANDAFRVHPPIAAPFGDEGAANHMRLAPAHDAPGVEIFVYGVSGGRFPARQHEQASRAIARLHGLSPDHVVFIEQAPEAIAAGAFHNDVVAVANGPVLFTHERAFANREAAHAAIHAAAPWCEIVEVTQADVPLADAITSYLFNAQLVTLPDDTGMALIVPLESVETPSVARTLDRLISGNGPIRRVIPVNVRQSMANGGGPACLRLRVVADPATVDPRFMINDAKLDRAAAVIAAHWPEEIAADALGSVVLREQVISARAALLDALNLAELG
jgi:succinylarginine dihydrolase